MTQSMQSLRPGGQIDTITGAVKKSVETSAEAQFNCADRAASTSRSSVTEVSLRDFAEG